MKRINEIKNALGSRYVFIRYLAERDVRRLIKMNPVDFGMCTVQSLTAGCVKIEINLYRQNGKMSLGYDVFVKDDPESTEWICYDSPNDAVSFREDTMLWVLDRVVNDNGLSYTECCFDRLNGITADKKRIAEGHIGE